jgi:hypothetical protein
MTKGDCVVGWVWPLLLSRQEQAGVQGSVAGDLQSVTPQYAYREPLGQGCFQPAGCDRLQFCIQPKVAGPACPEQCPGLGQGQAAGWA